MFNSNSFVGNEAAFGGFSFSTTKQVYKLADGQYAIKGSSLGKIYSSEKEAKEALANMSTISPNYT